mgnify:CR=1 FL=1
MQHLLQQLDGWLNRDQRRRPALALLAAACLTLLALLVVRFSTGSKEEGSSWYCQPVR